MSYPKGTVSLPGVPPPPVVDPPTARTTRLRTTRLDSNGLPVGPGLDLGGALISGGMAADTDPFPGPTLSTDQQRTISVLVPWSDMTAEGYRLLLNQPYARHDIDVRDAHGWPALTTGTIRALRFAESLAGRPYSYGPPVDCSGFMRSGAMAAAGELPDDHPWRTAPARRTLRQRLADWWFGR